MKPHPLIAQLAKERRAAGITRAQVADRAHVPERSIAHWEDGQHSPRTDRAIAYADAIGLLLLLRSDHQCLHCGHLTTPAPGIPVSDVHGLIYELRRIRLTANLTQNQAAQLGRVTWRSVSNWENGEALPLLPPLFDYLTGLGCSLTAEPIPSVVAS